MLNDLHLRRGPLARARPRATRCSSARPSPSANRLDARRPARRGHQRPLASAAHRRRRALARVRLRDRRRHDLFPTTAASACSGWAASALAAGLRHGGRVQRRRRSRSRRGRQRGRRDRAARPPARAATAASARTAATTSSRTASSPTRSRRTAMLGTVLPGDLPRRRGVPAQRRAVAPRRAAARADRACSRRSATRTRPSARTTSKLALLTVLAGGVLGTRAGRLARRRAHRALPRLLSLPACSSFAPSARGASRSRVGDQPAARRSLGALGAVRRAVALPPAEAMRPEPPPRFRAGVLERSGWRVVLPSRRG